MIDTRDRKPEDTQTALRGLASWARGQGLLPRHVHLGFFNLRDMVRMAGLDPWTMSQRVIIAPPTVFGIPYRVISLEDHVSMCVVPAGSLNAPPILLEWVAPGNITRKD